MTQTNHNRPTDTALAALLRQAAAGTRARLHGDTVFSRRCDRYAAALEADAAAALRAAEEGR